MQKGAFSASVLSEFEEKHAGRGSVRVVLGTLWVMMCTVSDQSQVVELHAVGRLEKPVRAPSSSSPESSVSLVTPEGVIGQKLTRLLIMVTSVKQVPHDEGLPFGSWTNGALHDKGVQCYGRALKLWDLGQY